MQIYSIRVTPEVARLRAGDAGTRNVSVVHSFSRHPTYFVGEVPRELLEDSGLEVEQLSIEDARHTLRQGALVSAHDCFSGRLAKILNGSAPPPPSPDLLKRVEALERTLAELQAVDTVDVLDRLPEMNRDELHAVHEQVFGRKPHGNARNDSIRDAIREALEAPPEETK